MEWAVPLQKIDVNKINVGQIRYGEKPLAPLAYYDGPIHLPSVNILLPALLVKDYDPQTGRLKLAIQDKSDVLHTLSSIQETLLKIVFQKQTEWFPGSRKTSEELHVFFQPFVEYPFHLKSLSIVFGVGLTCFEKENRPHQCLYLLDPFQVLQELGMMQMA